MATSSNCPDTRASPSPSPSPSKASNPRFLSFVLQSCVMVVVIALFFLFVGIASIFVVHICIASRASVQRRRRRRHHHHAIQDDELDAFFENGLSPNEIQKLPSTDYASILTSVVARDCAVCLEGFGEGGLFRILPRCKHAFHSTCIDLWLTKAPACPICRTAIQDL